MPPTILFAPEMESPQTFLIVRQTYTSQAYLLGLLAKIKCSICSYQLNLWYVAHGVT